MIANEPEQLHRLPVLRRAPLLQLSRPGHRTRDERAFLRRQERRERLVGEKRQEGLVLGQPAAERVHEDRAAVGVGAEEIADVVLALHQLRQDRAAVHDVHRLAARPQPSAAQLHRPRVGEHAPRAPGHEGLLQDLLIGSRLHLRPVRDGHGGARGDTGGDRAQDGLDEAGDRGPVGHGSRAGEGAEDGKPREQLGHAVPVAEAGGGVAVDLDEPRPRGTQERVQAGKHDVGKAGVQADPAGLGLRGSQERAQPAGIAVEGAAGHARRQLQQPPPVVAQAPPRRPAHEVRPEERAHGPAVERDPGRGERVFELRRLLDRGRSVHGDQAVVFRDRI